MKIKYLILTLMFQLAAMPLFSTPDPVFIMPEENLSIAVNNRVLANVNDKAISVIDVMKKLDFHFYRQYPQYTSSVAARFQFYKMHWKRILQELIDKELVVADAEENKLQVSSGDVRQEMETLFGPNIHANLDKIGLSYSEAWKIVHSDITIRRMMYIKATSKALKQITPQLLVQEYEEFAKNNIRPDIWKYTVITIREKDRVKGAEAAHQAYTLAVENKVPLAEVPKHVSELASVAKTTKITCSEEFQHEAKDLSEAYKQTLDQLESNSYSQPIPQKSRADNSTVYRIFYLKEKVPGGPIPFNEAVGKLRENLLDVAVEEESKIYITKLRKHFNVQEAHLDELTSDDFEPFELIES